MTERAEYELKDQFRMYGFSAPPKVSAGVALAVIRAHLDYLYPDDDTPVVMREGVLK